MSQTRACLGLRETRACRSQRPEQIIDVAPPWRWSVTTFGSRRGSRMSRRRSMVDGVERQLQRAQQVRDRHRRIEENEDIAGDGVSGCAANDRLLLEQLANRAHHVRIAAKARDVNPCPALHNCVKDAQASIGSLLLARVRRLDSALSWWTLACSWFVDSAFDLRALVCKRFVVSFTFARGKAFDARCLLSPVCAGRCAWLLGLRGARRAIRDGDWQPPEVLQG
jgi:hypothetical protein